VGTRIGQTARRRLGVLRRRIIARYESRSADSTEPYEPPDLDAMTAPIDGGSRRISTWRKLVALAAEGFARWNLAVENWAGATRACERGLSADPRHDRLWFALGTACEHGGPIGYVNDQRVGLIAGPVGDPTTALRAYESAISTAPGNARYRLRRGVVLSSMGEFDAALAAIDDSTRLEPSAAETWFQRGRVIESRASHRGAFLDHELEEMHANWQRALDHRSSHGSARYHLVRSLVTDAQWQHAATAALSATSFNGAGPSELAHLWSPVIEPGEAAEDVRAFISNRGPGLHGLTPDWWYVLHVRLHALGEYVLAYDVKKNLAAGVASTRQPLGRAGVTSYLDVARALSYNGDLDGAVDHVAAADWHSLPRRERAAFDKLLADLELRRGDSRPLRAMLHIHRGANPTDAEAQFTQLITGRRIAVVGPGSTPIPNGDEIDGFDTVIRTKVRGSVPDDVAAMAGTRTDISYYSDASVRLLDAEIREALSSRRLTMAVVRPSTYDRARRKICRFGDLRYMPSQDSATFESTHFAMQRIIYDVVRYDPANVKLFNIDFYLSQDPYVVDYTSEVEDIYRANDLRTLRTAAVHDLYSDFDFVQCLHRRGLVDVDDRLVELLRMTPDEYLVELERASGGPPTF
jgi:tetratricopeptide (TPR) repeat protein